jgi:hypothetical protein
MQLFCREMAQDEAGEVSKPLGFLCLALEPLGKKEPLGKEEPRRT